MISSAEEFIALRLSEDPEAHGRAARDEAPLAVWQELIETHPEMKQWVALNETVPIEVLLVLMVDPDPRVRFSVAMKRKLTVEMFERLADDEDDSVRHRISLNRKTPEHVLRRLVDDGCEMVRKAALERFDK